MRTKYRAVAPDGTVFTRATQSRKYAFVVVRYLADYVSPHDGRRWPGGWASAEWRATKKLADDLANTYRGKPRIEQVHVLPAEEVA